MTTRDQYVLSYTDFLLSDPGLWRLTVDYLCTCGDIGKEMADAVLIRVPLNLKGHASPGKRRVDEGTAPPEAAMDIQIEDGDLSDVVRELNKSCYEHDREPVRRMICRVSGCAVIGRHYFTLVLLIVADSSTESHARQEVRPRCLVLPVS